MRNVVSRILGGLFSIQCPDIRPALNKFSRTRQTDWIDDDDQVDDNDGEIFSKADVTGKRYSPATLSTITLLDERRLPYDLILLLLEKLCLQRTAHMAYSSAILIFMPGLAEIRKLHGMLSNHKTFSDPGHFYVYPLHSSISSEDQSAVFDVPPEGVRKIVIGA